MPRRPTFLRASDLRALAALATDAASGAADIAEGVHASVWRTLGVRGRAHGRTRGITGSVYRAVRAIARLVGRGLDAALGRFHSPEHARGRASGESRQRQAFLAALNGVLGDRLAATGNALATPMTLRFAGEPRLPLAPEATGRIVLLVHGLCMNDLQWQARHEGRPVDHGATLAAHGFTPVYARYNSGLHVSQNGRELASHLEALVARWPVPVESLTVVAHSMGGLLTRSALHVASGEGLRWPGLLRRVVFLGTPHHGSPLERGGNWIDTLLAQTPYSAPLAALGQVRSAGVTDLRHGNVLDADWQGAGRFERRPDAREILPLPAGVACYAVAATTGQKRDLGLWRSRSLATGSCRCGAPSASTPTRDAPSPSPARRSSTASTTSTS